MEARERRSGTIVMTALCAFVVVLVVIQLWLLSASVEALLAGETSVLVPSALASLALFVVNGAILVRGLGVDRRDAPATPTGRAR